ncbi:MAG TPA: MotA/TolQ/ExbB proton channel family protein [Caulobacteraceae bacterium]|jgi:biopolymer transport protein ExbB|nr:MotA/TolQ/ExbB proton channel family protein [Caulobacteraceae bacterium]
MLETKKATTLIALLGAVALLTVSAPAFAQAQADNAAAPAAAADANAAAPAADAAAPAANTTDAPPATIKNAGKLTPVQMFIDATPVVKAVMIGLLLCSVLSWTLLVVKTLEFMSLNKATDRFVEAFRGARSIADINRLATSEEFEGNPLADMAAAASGEVELSRQAGLQVTGEHRDSTLGRAQAAVAAVQAGLAKRLSGGMQFLASVGSSGPFIGLFGTVYGIMNSFIGIANTNTTNLAVVAPGIAEALLATGIGLFAAIPAVIFYNYFQTRIAAFGTRTEGFVAELLNAISRQLDKGA